MNNGETLIGWKQVFEGWKSTDCMPHLMQIFSKNFRLLYICRSQTWKHVNAAVDVALAYPVYPYSLARLYFSAEELMLYLRRRRVRANVKVSQF